MSSSWSNIESKLWWPEVGKQSTYSFSHRLRDDESESKCVHFRFYTPVSCTLLRDLTMPKLPIRPSQPQSRITLDQTTCNVRQHKYPLVVSVPDGPVSWHPPWRRRPTRTPCNPCSTPSDDKIRCMHDVDVVDFRQHLHKKYTSTVTGEDGYSNIVSNRAYHRGSVSFLKVVMGIIYDFLQYSYWIRVLVYYTNL